MPKVAGLVLKGLTTDFVGIIEVPINSGIVIAMPGVIYLDGIIIITWRENSTINPSQEEEDKDANVSAMEGQIPIIVVIVLPGTQVSQGASTLYFSNQSST